MRPLLVGLKTRFQSRNVFGHEIASRRAENTNIGLFGPARSDQGPRRLYKSACAVSPTTAQPIAREVAVNRTYAMHAPNILVHTPELENLGADMLSKAVRFRQTHRTNGQPASTTSRKGVQPGSGHDYNVTNSYPPSATLGKGDNQGSAGTEAARRWADAQRASP